MPAKKPSSPAAAKKKSSPTMLAKKPSSPAAAKKKSSPPRDKGVKQRTCLDVIHRIQWDSVVDANTITVGYEDRFIGILEKPFTAFTWADLSTLSQKVTAIPQHRIVYFKYRDHIIYDKRNKTDHVFGSTGGSTLEAIIAKIDNTVAETAVGAVAPTTDPATATADAATTAAAARDAALPADKGNMDTGKLLTLNAAAESPPLSLSALELRAVTEDPDRPSHFICIPCDDPDILVMVNQIQKHALSIEPRLAPACTPLSALHITLAVLRCETQAEIRKAKRALSSDITRRLIHTHMPAGSPIPIKGVACFRDRVVHGCVRGKAAAALATLSKALLTHMASEGVNMVGNRDEYVPHMTILKPGRKLIREMGHVPMRCYEPFTETDFGVTFNKVVHLCPMGGYLPADNGFYHCVATIPIRPPVLLSPEDAAKAVRNVIASKADPAVADVCLTDTPSSIASFTSTPPSCKAELSSLRGVLVVLRGLPGSGKSHLGGILARALGPETVVCSNDDFFERDPSVPYAQAWATHKLPMARSACMAALEASMAAGVPAALLDNTNSTRYEYQAAEKLAVHHKYAVTVIEVPCLDASNVKAFCKRNAHDVPLSACETMWARWEPDARAIYVQPYGLVGLAVPSPRVRRRRVARNIKPLLRAVQQQQNGASSQPKHYLAAFLTPESRRRLLEAHPPRHTADTTGGHLAADHVTLSFDPDAATVATTPLGARVMVRIGRACADKLGQCVSAIVRLAETGEIVASTNRFPHITISYAKDSSAVYSNTLLAKMATTDADTSATIAGTPLELQAIIGMGTHSSDKGRGATGPVLERAAALCALTRRLPRADATAKIIALHVFDFDGTLFDTPGPEAGQAAIWAATGRAWDRAGWVSYPESLRAPQTIGPGPVLELFHKYQLRPNSRTVVLTGRREALRPEVARVLSDFGLQIAPSDLILRSAKSGSTSSAKLASLRALTRQHPHVRDVYVWDDLPANLDAFRALRAAEATLGGVRYHVADVNRMADPTSTPSDETERWLRSCGLIPTSFDTARAERGLDIMHAAWCAALRQLVVGPSCPDLDSVADAVLSDSAHALGRVALRFGSAPLGCAGDHDICFLMPQVPGLTVTSVLKAMAKSLRECGVAYVYTHTGARCPRLRTCIEFDKAPPVEFDVLVALVSSETFFKLASGDAKRVAGKEARLTALMEDAAAIAKEEDSSSHGSHPCGASCRALEGPLFLARVQTRLAAVGVSVPLFGRLITLTKELARLLHCTGNAFHCMRTFHWSILLLNQLESLSRDSGGSVVNASSLDALAAKCWSGIARMSPDTLGKLLPDIHAVSPFALKLTLLRLTSAVIDDNTADATISATPGQRTPATVISWRTMAGLVRDRPHFTGARRSGTTASSVTPAANALELTQVQKPIAAAAAAVHTTIVTIEHKCALSPVLAWELATYIRARLPTFLRRLEDIGVHVYPDSDSCLNPHFIRFAVAVADNLSSSVHVAEMGGLCAVLRKTLTPLRGELEAYRGRGAEPAFRIKDIHDTTTDVEEGVIMTSRDTGHAAASMSPPLEDEDLFAGQPFDADFEARDKLLLRILDWMNNTEARSHPLAFEPSLTAAERHRVHTIAQELGLISKSHGSGEDRHVLVTIN